MTFFSLLYECEQGKEDHEEKEWMQFKKRSSLNKEKAYEYVGNKLVKVQAKDDGSMYPAFYENLNLDSIIEKIYGQNGFAKMQKVLTHFLSSQSEVIYRQDIMRDMEDVACYKAFLNLRNQLQEVHQIVRYSSEVKLPEQRDSYYLKATYLYCEAVLDLSNFYDQHEVRSEGFRRLKNIIFDYTKGEEFTDLKTKAKGLKQNMEQIIYQLKIGEKEVKLRLGGDAEGNAGCNFTQSLAKVLGKLETSERSYLTNLCVGIETNRLETSIVEILAHEYKDLFKKCHEFVQENRTFIIPFITRIEDEIIFYISFIDYMNDLKEKGFSFCYPKISDQRVMNIQGLIDVSLAAKKQSAYEVISNEIELKEGEKGAWITGANQGGKTTFIRGIGQSAYFMALGLPIAARTAVLPLFERLYTHFPESEDQHTDNGKLKEELLKLESTLNSAQEKSLVLMNELFSSTTMKDGYEMGKQAIEKLVDNKATVFCVTHIISLAQENIGLVSLVAEVDEESRTYKIRRKMVDGQAHTRSLMIKYHLSYEEVKERLNDGSKSDGSESFI